jgi:large repetitive protein
MRRSRFRRVWPTPRIRTRVLQAFGLAFVVGVGLASSVAIGSASTSAGSATTTGTTTTGTTTAAPPTNSSPPTLSGSATVGATLSASPGSWSGDTPITYTYEWDSCNSSGGSCSVISGASSQTYTVASADAGHTIRVNVAAHNSAGDGGPVLSAPTAVVSAGPPVNTAAPTVSGTLAVGQTLTATPGAWSGAQPITIAYQWERCDTNGGNCNYIGGATAAGYTVTSADAGHRLIVVVTASNSDGSKPYTVTAGNLGGGEPVNTAAPKISGSLSIGSTLSVSSGTWSGTQPITVSYQWERCSTNGGNCGSIGGATGSSYKVTSSDASHRLIVVVTGKNSLGSHQVVVTAGNIGGGPPVTTADPKVSGSLSIGSTLTVSSGSWSGTQPITLSYQWDRCDTNGGNCQLIGGATGTRYTVTSADAGHRLVSVVTGKNTFGTHQAVATAGNVGGVLPSGAMLVSAITLPDRLVIDHLSFSPNPARSRAPIIARFHVVNSQGRPVQGALVFALGLPYGWTYNAPEAVTGGDGWATLTIRPTRNMPLRRGALVMFVRARKPGGSVLAGVSTRRLVQERIGR